VSDAWDPGQYHRFATERRQPFEDLLTLIAPIPGGRALDLGCGTGELTVELHRHLEAASTLGIDSSTAMLDRAASLASDGVRFEYADLATFVAPAPLDVVAANAALQWVPGHEKLLVRLGSMLSPGGQLAVQVPANHDHPSHRIAAAVAHEEPFLEALEGSPPGDPVAANVLTPELYAEVMHRAGFAEQHVRLQVYGHVLDSVDGVVEWTKGTSLTRFKRRLPEDLYARFLDRYRNRLREALGDAQPYFYAFKRILLWGRMPAHRGVREPA
jgi:trans-aconitate 2-methyltransferase